MHRFFRFLPAVALAAAFALPAQAQDMIDSVCLVSNGKINDGTFNQFTYEGMQRAVDDFGLDSTYIESQAATDYEANINTCITEGFDFIITVGWQMADVTYTSAQANPDVLFVGVDAFYADPLPNIVGIQAREDQAGFIVGALAALMTETGTVGGVYGPTEPPILRFRNGYEQGVAYINPEVNVVGIHVDDYYAPDRGAAAAEQLIGEDVDVIFGAAGETGSGGIKRAAELDTMVIGVDQDEYNTTFGGGETPGAENLITSAMKRVDNGVYQMIEAAVNGEEFPADSTFTLTVENDGIDFAPPHDSDVPDDVTDQMRAVLEGLKDGSIETGVDPVSGNLVGEEDATPEMTLTEEPMATAEATEAS
jgi:basic membrane lipoprotein Med (substrate-binding protein (PBP1-ABC) superfamily)